MALARLRFQLSKPSCRLYSSTPSSGTPLIPPMLAKIREDMKAAMRAKNSARLDVLRGLIAEATNAAKTSAPVDSDSRMLLIIQKKIKASEGAIKEFEQAGREDLKEKEASQISIMQTYIAESNLMGEGELQNAITQLIDAMKKESRKLDKGSVMKGLVGPGGSLDGALMDKKTVARLVEEAL